MGRPYIITPPAADLTSLDLGDVKSVLNVPHEEDDDYIAGLIPAVEREWIEDSGRVLLTSTWEEAFDDWPCGYFELNRYPAASITSIAYTKADGTIGTVSASLYYLSTATRKPRVYPKYGQMWPSEIRENGPSIRVRYVAGSASGDVIEEDILLALKMRIADRYRNRGDETETDARHAPITSGDRAWRGFVKRHALEV